MVRALLLAALVVAVAIGVMARSLGGPFIFDDVLLIPQNHYVHDFEHWPRWLTGRLWDTNFDVKMLESVSFWRPLVTASYALDWQLGGGSPRLFHATNLALHGCNAGLFFLLACGWLKSRGAALVAALTFAVHPVQTESAAWIAGRTDSLCALGLLMATLGLRSSAKHPLRGGALQIAGAAVAFASKEMAVLWPLLVTLELWARHRRPLTTSELWRLLRGVSPYAALSIAFALAHRLAAPPSITDAAVSLDNRLPLILEAYGRYVALLAWPAQLTMGWAALRVDGDWYAPHLGYAALGAASLTAAATVAFRQRKRRPLLALSSLGFVAGLLPVSGVVWLGYQVLVAPRFLYVPLMLAAVGLGRLVRGLLGAEAATRRTAAALSAACLVALSLRASARASDYASAERFWRREIESNPAYGPAQEYFIAREIQSSRPESALRLAHAWYQSPADVPEWFKEKLILKTLASLLALTQDIDRDGLDRIERFASALATGQRAKLELPAHRLHLDASGHPRLLSRLAIEQRTLRVMAAEAAVRLGKDELALDHLKRALSGCETCWPLLSTSALLTAQAGQTERALELGRRAMQLAPPGKLRGLLERLSNADAWKRRAAARPTPFHRASFHAALGSYGRAYAAARSAFESPPSSPGARAALARLAFQAGDVPAAQKLLRGVMSPEETQRELREFAQGVRWRDREPPPDLWLPSPARS